MHTSVCPVCGYIHEGEQGFHFCPVCGTSSRLFLKTSGGNDSGHWDLKTIRGIAEAASTGHFPLEGKGTTREFLNLDDLIFLPAQVSRSPLDDNEEVESSVTLGKKTSNPVESETPLLNAAMSFGALSRNAKMALARASSMVGGVANTGEGGMLDEERELAENLTLQYASGRFGVSSERLIEADIIEIKISQGAKPGMGGKLPGEKVTREIARIRQIPFGEQSNSPARHPDIQTPGELSQKIAWLREKTNGAVISLKIAGGKIEQDLEAIFSQDQVPDVLVIDGGEGGTGAAPVFIKDHVGLPLVFALPRVARFLDANGLRESVTLIAAGGIRHGADAAKAIALGAEAVYMAGALKIAMGCRYIRECHLGTCPYGIATQDPSLCGRLDVEAAALRIARYINSATDEIRSITRICGKNRIHDLNPDDLAAMTPQIARVTGVAPAWRFEP